MKKKQIIFNIIFYTLLSLLFCLSLPISMFILDILNGPVLLVVINNLLLVGALVATFILIRKKIYFKIIPFITYFISFAILLPLAKPIETDISIADYKNPTPTEVLTIRDGNIRGLYNKDKSVKMYAGIPYAKAPVGELRFKEPVNPDKWNDTRDCFTFGPKSMQVVSSQLQDSVLDIYAQKGWHPNFDTTYIQKVSEDSLYLNVWAPNTTKKDLPVLVFIHGGSLSTGSSAYVDYNGETFAKNGVVMVTITYRLNVFGYFAHEDLLNEGEHKTTGNYGLLDQIQALKWVNENIGYFGGDVNNITVAGESAGSSSVSALCLSPLAKGLFSKAIGESSSIVKSVPPHTFRSYESALETGHKIMEEFNCKTIDDLRKIPAETLLNTKYTNSAMCNDGYIFYEDLTPEEVYANKLNNETSLLNGYNVKEADAFYMPEYLLSPTNKGNIEERLAQKLGDEVTAKKICEAYKDEIEKDAFSFANEAMSIFWFIAPHHYWSNTALNAGVNVYRYQFTKENGYYGTYHSGEMVYAYGNLARKNKQFAYNQKDYDLSDVMVKYWTNFAKYSDPNGTDNSLPKWNPYSPNESKPIIELGENISMFEDKYLKFYQILDEYYYPNKESIY